MAKKCKCDPHEICEECPEWIFTLADLIMCMMGLFVILWVLKPGQEPQPGKPANEEMNKTLGAIREAFGYVPDPNSTDPIDLMLLEKLHQVKMNGPGERGKTRREPQAPEGTDPEVTTIRTGRQAAVGGRLLFERGSATLAPETLTALNEIVLEIRGHRNIVMIKGHASLDDLTDGATPEQRMDLSLRRAQAVSDFLTGQGVSPDTVRVQGCSIFEPVQQRAYTTDRQALNRRVEVDVTPSLVEELQDRSN